MTAPATGHKNELGQPIGPPMPNWQPPPWPPAEALRGRFCSVEPLAPAIHARDLHESNQLDTTGAIWTYLGVGPFETFAAYHNWLESVCSQQDPFFHAIIDSRTGKAVGVATLMRIDPPNGVIEVGNICFSPRLARTPAATESMYLFMRQVFALGYRRYEWKCDSLNGPSRAAARRLGFRYEGLFRQAVIYKNRSRDTAWFSILDWEWPILRQAFEAWLAPDNFDPDGTQRQRLSDLIGAAREKLAAN